MLSENLIINPGSKVANGTKVQSIKNANAWLKEMHDNGIRNVQIVGDPTPNNQSSWIFTFKHILTGVEADLVMHGLNEQEEKEYSDYNFGAFPRIYWNGSSSAEPKLEDFLTEGYYIDIVSAKQS